MAEKLTDIQLDSLEAWARRRLDVPMAHLEELDPYRNTLRAVAELRERRSVDRNLLNARSRGARWSGGRRRK